MTKQKKILFLIHDLGHGGAERVLVNLVNHMDKTKFDITVQTMFDVGIYKDKLDSSVRYIGGLKRYFRGNTLVFKLFSPKFLYKKYVKEKYDVIVSYLEGPSARIVSGCTDKDTKLISWIHIEQKNIDYASKVFRSKNEAKACYGKFDKIICVADTVKQDFLSIFDVKNPVEVLYNTVETDVIKQKSEEKVDDNVFSNESVNLISVAKLTYTKGYDRLVNITKRLITEGINVHTYIVGKGEEKSRLEEQIRENGIENNWTFVGFKTNPYKYVKNADLYVCSSRKEGFSTAVTESLIVGTPVVSTDCSGAKELLGYNNEYGIVTENNEESLYLGLKEMLTKPNLLASYKQKAEERGKKFNTKETVEAVENMLLAL